MSTAVPLSRSVRRIEWHTYITSRGTDGAHVCQASAVYTISKDVRHSLPSSRRDGKVGSAPPPPRQPVSLVLNHGRTDVMAMKDALGTMERRRPDARTTLDGRHLRTRWAAAPQWQPTNADSRRGHIRTTLTTGPAGLPHPATWASLPDTGAWTIARNCRSHRCDTHYTTALRSPPSVSCYRKPSRQTGYWRLHLVGVAAVSFCKHVTCLQRKHG